MKFLVVLALAIVVVSAKSLPAEKDKDLPKYVDNLHEEIKQVGDVFDDNPQALGIMEKFMNDIDADLQRVLGQDAVKSITVMLDSTKSMEQKFKEIAKITQHTADLWIQAEKKYKEDHPAVSKSKA